MGRLHGTPQELNTLTARQTHVKTLPPPYYVCGQYKSGHMVLKEVIWVHNDKIMLNGLERSQ